MNEISKNNKKYLMIAEICKHSEVFGKDPVAVIWFQGCNKDCYNCIAPEWKNPAEGKRINVDDLLEYIDSINNISGIVLSGGEPLLQIESLTIFLKSIKQKTRLNIIIYTGYKVDEIEKDPRKKEILSLADMLITGEYVDGLNNSRGIRGSSNQEILFLTDKFKDQTDLIINGNRNIEITIKNGSGMLIGIPPKGFDRNLI